MIPSSCSWLLGNFDGHGGYIAYNKQPIIRYYGKNPYRITTIARTAPSLLLSVDPRHAAPCPPT